MKSDKVWGEMVWKNRLEIGLGSRIRQYCREGMAGGIIQNMSILYNLHVFSPLILRRLFSFS